jgi:hypothetical protein
MHKCHPVKIHQEKQHWKDQVYINSKTLANAITLASSNEVYCLQYAQFIRLLEKLLTLPCGPAEEEFVQRFRRSVTIQSKKQLIEPVQYDEQGMAFSTSEGNDIPQRDCVRRRHSDTDGAWAAALQNTLALLALLLLH